MPNLGTMGLSWDRKALSPVLMQVMVTAAWSEVQHRLFILQPGSSIPLVLEMKPR